jgi:hypothetical protein
MESEINLEMTVLFFLTLIVLVGVFRFVIRFSPEKFGKNTKI